MNAIPPSPGDLDRPLGRTTDPTAAQWAALCTAAAAVASLAGAEASSEEAALRTFPAQIAAHGNTGIARARQGISDLAEIMEYGLKALLAARARGNDAACAARALLREFRSARLAILALASAGHANEPMPESEKLPNA